MAEFLQFMAQGSIYCGCHKLKNSHTCALTNMISCSCKHLFGEGLLYHTKTDQNYLFVLTAAVCQDSYHQTFMGMFDSCCLAKTNTVIHLFVFQSFSGAEVCTPGLHFTACENPKCHLGAQPYWSYWKFWHWLQEFAHSLQDHIRRPFVSLFVCFLCLMNQTYLVLIVSHKTSMTLHV